MGNLLQGYLPGEGNFTGGGGGDHFPVTAFSTLQKLSDMIVETEFGI